MAKNIPELYFEAMRTIGECKALLGTMQKFNAIGRPALAPVIRGQRIITKDRATTIDVKDDGFVAGWASTDDMDSYRHVVAAGAFSESIRKRGLTGPTGIKLLLDHDSSKPAGVIKSLRYVGGKLAIEAQLNLDIPYVRDRYSAIKLMGGANFSVGFSLQDYEIKQDREKREYIQINRGDLFEVSAVLFPANEFATMTSVKGLVRDDGIGGTVARINLLLGSLETVRAKQKKR